MGLMMGVVFLVLIFLGMPIGLSIGMSSLAMLFMSDLPFEMLPQMMFSGGSSFVLVAVPFFVLAGDVLAKGGISERIVSFAEASLGRLRGGLSIVSVVASMFIAAISGSGAATTAAVGAALLPQLEKKGYDLDFSASLIAAAGTIGVVIPPSVPMVLFATIAGESVAKLFLAGFVPGVIMGAALVAIALWVAHRRHYPAADVIDPREKRRRLVDALWGLMTPVIILGGIFSGVFTPSEAAAIAVDYSLVVAFVVYRELDWRKFYKLVVDAGVTSALVMFIIGTSTLFGWELAFCQAPEQVAEFMLKWAGGSGAMIYLMIMAIILIAGMFMETSSALIVLTPIFLPTVAGLGGNVIHFGLLVTVGLAIGMATPPVAINLYVASAITGLPMERLSRPIVPMILTLIVVLLVMTYFPSLTLFLPGLMGVQ
ncbi:TRAP transporter large permease [Pyramidobacter sp.]|uniref:TRAP transporter large permease n=1 Tax=Pyramidobacter sp. TaxID=1943581 RepID=UPI0025DE0DAC|nr:TRAP transporter large permease subunit [Pyramidobacter sp.]MCI7404787.1 TRAP transporter large permease subunit [Pyramidobacter sp.]MDY3212429.1 TRAP transporter large permease subunit [Pyramidobacter sp.]